MSGSESSVVVSLAEIMQLEHERVQTEAAMARRREDERREARARERHFELAREAERHAADLERQRLDREREREELVRLQVIRDANLERARREAELRIEADDRAALREG